MNKPLAALFGALFVVATAVVPAASATPVTATWTGPESYNGTQDSPASLGQTGLPDGGVVIMYGCGAGLCSRTRLAGHIAWGTEKVLIVLTPSDFVVPAVTQSNWLASDAVGDVVAPYVVAQHLQPPHVEVRVRLAATGAWTPATILPTPAQMIVDADSIRLTSSSLGLAVAWTAHVNVAPQQSTLFTSAWSARTHKWTAPAAVATVPYDTGTGQPDVQNLAIAQTPSGRVGVSWVTSAVGLPGYVVVHFAACGLRAPFACTVAPVVDSAAQSSQINLLATAKERFLITWTGSKAATPTPAVKLTTVTDLAWGTEQYVGATPALPQLVALSNGGAVLLSVERTGAPGALKDTLFTRVMSPTGTWSSSSAVTSTSGGMAGWWLSRSTSGFLVAVANQHAASTSTTSAHVWTSTNNGLSWRDVTPATPTPQVVETPAVAGPNNSVGLFITSGTPPYSIVGSFIETQTPPAFASKPHIVIATKKSTVVLHCVVAAVAAASTSVSWIKDGHAFSGHSGSVLTVSAKGPRHAYRCVVRAKNSFGSAASTSAALSVK